MTNYLKTVRKADTYIPARENMAVCRDAVKLATANGKWQIINAYELRPEIEEDFQVYKNLDKGKAYAEKSLPAVVKNYKDTMLKSVIIYVGQYFGIFPFLEFLQLYAECTLEVRRLLDPILAKV